MMKKTKLIRGGIMALFVLAALLLVYLVVRQTMPDIIPLLRSGDEEALEAYLSRDMSFTGILYMALLQMVQVWSIVISGVIVNVAAGVVYGVWRAFAIWRWRSQSSARLIAVVMSQAPGLFGTPSWGQRSSAATSASCASSSATPRSRTRRATAATMCADSMRQTAAMVS